jgi:menaquinone-specific isochorismate synthase
MDWLAAQENPVKMYWSSRDAHLEIAAVGLADMVDSKRTPCPDPALSKIEKNLADASADVRYYGGICFDMADSERAAWEGLGHYYFFVPEFELRQENDQSVFLFNIMMTPQDDVNSITEQFLKSFDSLSFDIHTVPAIPTDKSCLPSVLRRFDTPDQNSWQQQTRELIGLIQANRVKKIVQTRITSLELLTTPDPFLLLYCLKSRSINTYNFCFQIDRYNSFMGCSPECLYKKDGNHIYTEALAGTNVRNPDPEMDMQLQKELLQSQKEIEEHRYVFKNIKSELENICNEVVVNKREILLLEHIQHLRSRFEGTLKKGVCNRDILHALHPTAAVNGYPKKAAMALIRQYESFSRGWYAGPVGWIGRHHSEFAVAIRSAHITGQQIRLFAGAGIVSASDPDREWGETEIKMAPFLNLFKPSLGS